ncbi:MAG: rRNA maturation RNase YbeY [Candidatus Marinimicrobia bacterium]|nr:rRNA maturation RNase YbeY [Candidatus Neomarinimicrobiota bacterium]
MIKINISEVYKPLPIFSSNQIKQCVESIFFDNKITSGYVHFILVTDDYLRKLKCQYFNMDVFTDVMTFNLEERGENIDGEVYISWDRILENACKFNLTPQEEFKRILIHGCLHLLGFDDKTDEGKSQMTYLENLYLDKYPEVFYS